MQPVTLMTWNQCTVLYIAILLVDTHDMKSIVQFIDWMPCHECRPVTLLFTVQYIDFMSWVSVESIYFLWFTLCLLIQSLWFTLWLITSLIIVRFWCSLHHWKALDLLFQNITSICIWHNVMSVDRLHCYVQYSTLISCQECRQMH